MDTIQQLKTLIQQQFDIDPNTVDPEEPFATYNLDSLTLAELLFAIEDTFHVTVPDDAVGSLTNLGEVARMVDGLLVARQA